MEKICPAGIFYAPTPAPEWTGETYEDLVAYVKELRAHIKLMNEDRAEIGKYCENNTGQP